MVALSWASGSKRETLPVTITPSDRRSFEIAASQIELRTALGETYMLSVDTTQQESTLDEEIPDFSALRARHRPLFGRERLMQTLDEMVSARDDQVGGIFLSGSPGTGKTAALCQFLDIHEKENPISSMMPSRSDRHIPHLFNLRDFSPDSAARAL